MATTPEAPACGLPRAWGPWSTSRARGASWALVTLGPLVALGLLGPLGLLGCRAGDGRASGTSGAASARARAASQGSARPSASQGPAASASPGASGAATATSADPRGNTPGLGESALPLPASDLCAAADGPFALRSTGAPSLSVRKTATGSELVVVSNDAGRPRLERFAIGPRGAARSSAPAGEEPTKTSLLPCATALDMVFCTDASGLVRRGRLADDGKVLDEAEVVRTRPGAPLAAAPLGGQHVMLAYLVDAQRKEGAVTEAWATVDGGAPVRLSEDGAGATFATLAPWGSAVAVLYVDSRSALTPIHARVARYEGGGLSLGPDAVVHVGGPYERYVTGAISVRAGGGAMGLVPLSTDEAFGLTTFPIDDPPKVDVGSKHTAYPNGLDPAPVAATVGQPGAVVAVVRPRSREAASPRVLELGRVDERGAFRGACVLAEAARVTHVALAPDDQATLWVAWSDDKGAHLQRLGR